MVERSERNKDSTDAAVAAITTETKFGSKPAFRFSYDDDMRLFIAITVPAEIRRQLEAVCRPFAALAAQTVWCKPEQFHVTLAFIGEAAPAFLPHLRQALDRACASVPALACRAAGFGYFGSRRSPAVLWAGVEPAEELEALHDLLWRTLEPMGYERPSPRFHPHITLARCKERARNQAVLDAMDQSEDDVFGDWTAGGATLYESKLTPRGPLYHALHTAPFAG